MKKSVSRICARRLRVEAARRHEVERLGQPVGELLVLRALRRVGDETLVPAMDPMEIGIAALGEGAQQVERRRRLAERLDHALRIGPARLGRELRPLMMSPR